MAPLKSKNVVSQSTISDDFPRGNPAAEPVKLKPVSVPMAEGALFVENGDADQVTMTTKRKAKDALGSKKKQRTEAQIFSLKPRTLVQGMVLMGAIKEIHGLELVIALPNSLTGTVNITEISEQLNKIIAAAEDDEDAEIPELSDMFLVGQLVVCSVTELTTEKNKKRIALSLMPSKVNVGLGANDLAPGMVLTASVKSCEDHGFMMDLGIEGLAAFLSKNNVGSADLQVGSLKRVAILSEVKNKVVQLHADCGKISKDIIREDSITDRVMIKPGFLVAAKITSVCESGLWVKVFGVYEAAIEWSQAFDANTFGAELDLTKHYQVGQKIKARVLYAYPNDEDSNMNVNAKQRLALSLLPNLVSLKLNQFADDLKVGSIIEDAQVVRVDSGMGLMVQINETTLGYAHISRVSDTHIASLDSKPKYAEGTTHKARVMSLGYLDGLVQLSLQPSIVNAPIFRYEDIQVGQVINNAIIQRLDPKSGTLYLSLADSTEVRAFCPKSHLTDLPTVANPEKRFKAGDKIKVRVLSNDPEARKIAVTHKKTLVNCPLPIITSVDQVQRWLLEQHEKCWTYGVVTGVKDFGLIVAFFGMVKGMVHISQLPKLDQTSSPLSHYTTGQLVKCRVISVAADGKLRLSMLMPKSQTKKQPVGTDISKPEDIVVGLRARVFVKSVKDMQANVVVMEKSEGRPQIIGRIHITELFDEVPEGTETGRALFDKAGVKAGSTVDAKVVGFHDAKTHRWLPLTHPSGARSVVELSIKPSQLESKDLEKTITLESVKVGDVMTGFVSSTDGTSTSKNAMWLALTPNLNARIGTLEVSCDLTELHMLEQYYPLGKPVKAQVVALDADKNVIEMSIRALDGVILDNLNSVPRDAVLCGRVVRVSPNNGLLVQISQLGNGIVGRVALTDIADTYTDRLTEEIQKDDLVMCRVVGIDTSNKHLDLSLRASRVKNVDDVTDQEINVVEDLKQGQLLRGFIKNVAANGLFVSLGRSTVGRVKIAEMFDEFVKDWQSKFIVGQLVRARVISIENGRIELSLKLSQVDPEQYRDSLACGAMTITDLEKGAIVTGTVAHVEPFGVFIELDNTRGRRPNQRIRGLCHRSELADQKVADVSALYSVGDRVKAVLLDINVEKHQLSLGMKSSYLYSDVEESADDEDEEMAEVESDDSADGEPVEEDSADENDAIDEDSDEEMESDGNEFVDVEASESEDEEMEDISPGQTEMQESTKKESAASIALDLAGSFSWGAEWSPDNEAEVELDEEDDDTEKNPRKVSKRARQRQKMQEETEIARKEAQMASGETEVPTCAAEFDRLLLASPNSSYLWVQYMAFYLNVAELEKSRQVAERALKTINFREEKEKFNIWIAYMNLENRFGTPESLQKIFERAVSFNEPKHVYLALATIYEKSENYEKADELFETITKKFKRSCKVWIQCGLYHFHRQNLDQARDVLSRALKVLPKHKHIKAILKFARFEYKFGDVERARTVFERLLGNFPKRVDIWSVFLDLEVAHGNVENARRLFERAVHLKLSSKKSKFFFKKYLDFEKKHGNDETVQHVVQLARSYIESLVARNNEAEDEE